MFISQKVQSLCAQNKDNEDKINVAMSDLDHRILTSLGQNLQTALFTSDIRRLSLGIDLCPFQLGYDKDYAPIYGINGWLIEEQDLDYVRINLVKIIHQKIIEDKYKKDKGIVIIYFKKGSKEQIKKLLDKQKKKQIKTVKLNLFKQSVFYKIQSQFLKKIKQIYIIQQSSKDEESGFFQRRLNGKKEEYQSNKIIDNMIQLKAIKDFEQVVRLGPLFELKNIFEPVKLLFKPQKWQEYLQIHSKGQKKLAFEKMQLQERKTLYRLKISEYLRRNQEGIPIFLDALVKVIQSDKQLANCQGIFRKGCQEQNLQSLQKQLQALHSQHQMISSIKKYDAHTIANCIKKFIIKLDPPLFRYKYYNQLAKKLKIAFNSTPISLKPLSQFLIVQDNIQENQCQQKIEQPDEQVKISQQKQNTHYYLQSSKFSYTDQSSIYQNQSLIQSQSKKSEKKSKKIDSKTLKMQEKENKQENFSMTKSIQKHKSMVQDLSQKKKKPLSQSQGGNLNFKKINSVVYAQQDEKQKQSIISDQSSNILAKTNKRYKLHPYQDDNLMAFISYYIREDERKLWLRLFYFFRDTILINEKNNGVNSRHLAVVLSPCIFKPRQITNQIIQDTPRIGYILQRLLKKPQMLE